MRQLCNLAADLVIQFLLGNHPVSPGAKSHFQLTVDADVRRRRYCVLPQYIYEPHFVGETVSAEPLVTVPMNVSVSTIFSHGTCF